MTTVVDWFKWLIGLARPENLQALVNMGGPWWVSYAILAAIIFSETGLLVGFFLPGDSLLFTAGFLASKQVFDVTSLVVVLSIAAVVGDALNYYVGLEMGEYVFERGRVRFVKHSHLMAAKAFYERHGGKAIVLARFVPLVRTFTPFVAGVARMGYRRFVVYNIIGGVGWVASMTLAGYWLGQRVWIQQHFELTVLAVVFVSILPMIIGLSKKWLSNRATAPPVEASTPLE